MMFDVVQLMEVRMLISSPCPLSHVLAYHNEQTLGALEKSVETLPSYILLVPSIPSRLSHLHPARLAHLAYPQT